MDLRHAEVPDLDGIRRVAGASLEASYGHALEADVREEALEQWYGDGTDAEWLEDDDTIVLVAVDGGDVIGVAQCVVVEGRERVGQVDWLHVDPDHRGEGLGTDLLGGLETELLDRDVDAIEGRVLRANREGVEFYESHGFEEVGERTVEIGEEEFAEARYRQSYADTEEVLEGTAEGADGETVYVAYDETERGSMAPFYAGYLDAERGERYGYVCGNCEGTDVAMDAMGRVECSSCDNRRKPTRWDAAYL